MKIIISYISIFIILTLFALFLDATSGFFVIAIFISAIAVSTLLHIYAIAVFDCDIEVNSDLVEKGEDITVIVRVRNKGKFPAFFLPTIFKIRLDLSEHLRIDGGDNSGGEFTVNLGSREKLLTFTLTPQYWGKASIGLESVQATDLLGIFGSMPILGKFRDTHKIFEKNIGGVKIFPAIPMLSAHSDFVRTLEEASVYDDNEQSREVAFAVTGFPGYEHRDYVPGDPLKRVNWKLSAKRDRLLVRKPEAFAGGDQILILDVASCEIAQGKLLYEQVAIESMLALAVALTKREILCKIYVRFESGWQVTQIAGADEIERLRHSLCDYSFTQTFEHGRLPEITESASGFVIFTARPDLVLHGLTEPLRQRDITPEITSPVNGPAANWRIEESHGEVIFVRCT